MNRVLSLKSCQRLAQSPLVYLASYVKGWEFATDLPQDIGLCRNRTFKFLDKILLSLILDFSVFNKSGHVVLTVIKICDAFIQGPLNKNLFLLERIIKALWSKMVDRPKAERVFHTIEISVYSKWWSDFLCCIKIEKY